ncbi:MAG: cell division protein FtsK, partial [Streptococcus sp.]
MTSQSRDVLNQSYLQSYLLQSLNMALGALMQGETSYTNSFNVIIQEDGFVFVPRLPCAYILDDDLYKKIFLIANASLYPQYTLLKQNATYFVPLETDDLHIQRGLFFPWKKGISERLAIPDLDKFSASLTHGKIPVMNHFELNLDRVNHWAIAGNSGSGKSYALTEQLSQCATLIQKRQAILYDNPNHQFAHLTIVIDEVLALSEGVNKNIKEAFFSLLSQIALLGRATKIHLFLVSQRFDHNTIPISVREQLNVLLQIGNINQKTTQFLFPDLD